MTVEPLFAEPEVHVIHPLPAASMHPPWRVAAHATLVSQSRRFEGRTDMVGRRAMRYLSDCSLALAVNVPQGFVQAVTRLRWEAIRSLMRIKPKAPHQRRQAVAVAGTIAVIRDLHHKIIEVAESTSM